MFVGVLFYIQKSTPIYCKAYLSEERNSSIIIMKTKTKKQQPSWEVKNKSPSASTKAIAKHKKK